MNKNIYGYIRVSSIDQNEERQRIALKKAGVNEKKIYWISSPGRILTDQTIRNLSEN